MKLILNKKFCFVVIVCFLVWWCIQFVGHTDKTLCTSLQEEKNSQFKMVESKNSFPEVSNSTLQQTKVEEFLNIKLEKTVSQSGEIQNQILLGDANSVQKDVELFDGGNQGKALLTLTNCRYQFRE